MIIDAHQHFWHYTPREFGWIADEMEVLKRDFLPEHLQAQQQRVKFDGSVTVQARQSLEETKWLLQLADAYAGIRAVVGWVDLCAPAVEKQLEEFSPHCKLRGVRHVLQDEADDDFMLRDDFQNGIRQLHRFGLTYDILIFPRHLTRAVEMVRRFPDQLFVLDHIGKPAIRQGIMSPWREDIRKLGEFPNVYAKLSGMVTEADWKHWQPEQIRPYIDVAMEAFGPGRLMMGSDWPVCTVAGDYARVTNIVVDYLRSCAVDEQEAVLGKTAMDFYGIKES